ncbi:MAG: hypothetical protein SVX43_01995 [Cyanobacteriota bacterium]|nr:hypothetical protein [Cyanobacteriota bacterium]
MPENIPFLHATPTVLFRRFGKQAIALLTISNLCEREKENVGASLCLLKIRRRAEWIGDDFCHFISSEFPFFNKNLTSVSYAIALGILYLSSDYSLLILNDSTKNELFSARGSERRDSNVLLGLRDRRHARDRSN